MSRGEEKKAEGDKVIAYTPKDHEQKTQASIRSLYKVSLNEFMTPSVGDAYSVPRDPHLRLRRTLTPSLNLGIPKYAKAQFMLSRKETTGKRVTLSFGAIFDDAASGEKRNKSFTMDAYAWGASETEATVRIVTLHGISPGVSRTRWHRLGERYALSENVRFVALDWHSIDRSVDDDSNDEFLTCLPKHIMDDSLSGEEDKEEFIQQFASPEMREKMLTFLHALSKGFCPRNYDDGARILRGVIEEGLGWGKDDTPFVLGLKSWSGGIGMRMLAEIHRSDGAGKCGFATNIQGAIIMHRYCLNKRDIMDAMSSGIIPTALMCWAKDDPLIPYGVSRICLDANDSNGRDTSVKLVTYERGGHHNFDGSDGLPNFDDEVEEWVGERFFA